ncbi:MAG: tRNA dihydrouridine synthase DusB [Litorimonas sp.]
MSLPLHIGDMQLRSRVLVAPMSGVTDLPFRRTLQHFQPGLVVSEMVAGEGLAKGDPENIARAAGGTELDPLAIQLVGRDPHWMGKGAQLCEAAGAQIIDINMGCPARKVTSGLSGSALMREPKLAQEIIEAVIDAVEVPVTLKTRLGWDDESLNAAEICVAAQEAGVEMFVIHGRTRCQFYKGDADWAAVRTVVDAVERPVFVNGDIHSPDQAEKAMERSGAQGVMLGRALIGAPWLLRDIMARIDGNSTPKPLSARDKASIALQHYNDILDFYPVGKGLRIARKHLAGYCDSAALRSDDCRRQQICRSLDEDEVRAMLSDIFLNPRNLAA